MTDPKCGLCLYYEGGDCHRYPPTVWRDVDGEVRPEWPMMNDEDWCGEFATGESADVERF